MARIFNYLVTALALGLNIMSTAHNIIEEITENPIQKAVTGQFNHFEVLDIEATNSTTSKLYWISNYSSYLFSMETNPNGVISTGCRISVDKENWIILGGSFSTLNGTKVSNIAAVNKYGLLYDMKGGVDGKVDYLFCDNTSGFIYVFGNFTNVNAYSFSSPIYPSFPGAAMFSLMYKQWKYFPFSGLNGDVKAATRSLKTNLLWFAGNFTSTMDGITNDDYINLPVDLSHAVITATNSSKKHSDPYSLVCNPGNNKNNNGWVAENYSPASISFEFDSKLNVSMISIKNNKLKIYGTKVISFYSKINSTLVLLEMLSMNQDTMGLELCTSCTVFEDPDKISTFAFPEPMELDNIIINATEWYGKGVGLGKFEIFQTNPTIHPNGKLNLSKCKKTFSSFKQISKIGDWVEVKGGKSNQSFLESSLLTANKPSIGYLPSIILSPFIASYGLYDVYMTIPACSNAAECRARAAIKAQVGLNKDSSDVLASNVFNISVDNDAEYLLYSGFIPPSGFGNDFYISIAYNLTENNIKDIIGKKILAGNVKLIRKNSFKNLYGLIMLNSEYDPGLSKDVVEFDFPAISLPKESFISSVVGFNDTVYFVSDLKNSTQQIFSVNITEDKIISQTPVPGKINSMRIFNNNYIYAGGSLFNSSDRSGNIYGLSRIDLQKSKSGSSDSLEILPDFKGSVLSLLSRTTSFTFNNILSFIGSFSPTIKNQTSTPSYFIGHYNVSSNVWLDPTFLEVAPTMACYDLEGIALSSNSISKLSLYANGFSIFSGRFLGNQTKLENQNLVSFLTPSQSLFSETAQNYTMIESFVYFKGTPIVGGYFSNGVFQNIAKYSKKTDEFQKMKISDLLDFGDFNPKNKFGMINDLFLSNSILAISGVGSTQVSYPRAKTRIDNFKALSNNSKADAFNTTKKDQKLSFNGFTVYDLSKNKVEYNLELESDEYNTLNQTFEFKKAIVNLDQHGFIVAGKFPSNLMNGCENLCEFKLLQKRWVNIGGNIITGEINSMTIYSERVFIAGDLKVKDNPDPQYFVNLDFIRSKGFFVNVFNTSEIITGPVQHISYYKDSNLFITGKSAKDNSTFLVEYDGTNFNSFNMSGIVVSDLNEVSVLDFYVISEKSRRAPLLTGKFTLKGTDERLVTCSAILYVNGKWLPYIKVFNADGSYGVIKKARNLDKPSTYYNLKPSILKTYLILLISSIVCYLFLILIMGLFSIKKLSHTSYTDVHNEDYDSGEEYTTPKAEEISKFGFSTRFIDGKSFNDKKNSMGTLLSHSINEDNLYHASMFDFTSSNKVGTNQLFDLAEGNEYTSKHDSDISRLSEDKTELFKSKKFFKSKQSTSVGRATAHNITTIANNRFLEGNINSQSQPNVLNVQDSVGFVRGVSVPFTKVTDTEDVDISENVSWVPDSLEETNPQGHEHESNLPDSNTNSKIPNDQYIGLMPLSQCDFSAQVTKNIERLDPGNISKDIASPSHGYFENPDDELGQAGNRDTVSTLDTKDNLLSEKYQNNSYDESKNSEDSIHSEKPNLDSKTKQLLGAQNDDFLFNVQFGDTSHDFRDLSAPVLPLSNPSEFHSPKYCSLFYPDDDLIKKGAFDKTLGAPNLGSKVFESPTSSAAFTPNILSFQTGSSHSNFERPRKSEHEGRTEHLERNEDAGESIGEGLLTNTGFFDEYKKDEAFFIRKESLRKLEKAKAMNSLIQRSNLNEYPKYLANYDFNSGIENELSFSLGDIIYVTDMSDGVWWTGIVERGFGRPLCRGIFPRSYVSKITES
ncbi:hypothetical protein BB560_003245 [Smittium megazygosporum]|uniref:SH3 domain-containing protein n=1 Tax=Smittium megazygosporum TaxID=133381 RepID=A0A2T9ZCH4_9FUNG|nr:hypothetical protein BB560_003245 [Smittium megazygosporum]